MRPILCSPHDESQEHWVYHGPGELPARAPTRRPASYYYATRPTIAAQFQFHAEQQRDDLPLVDLLPVDVERWREAGYPGAETVTKQFPRHRAWRDLG